MEPDLDLVAEAIGSPPKSWEPVRSGYTRSRAWRMESPDGPVFVKEAADEGSLSMLRSEALVYPNVSGAFIPGFIGFADRGARAALAIEYLDDAHWPPPYPDPVNPLFVALETVSAARAPAELRVQAKRWSRWERVAADPEPLLSLGVCSRDWLERSLGLLIEAEAGADFEGDALVHNDVYSSNVCFAGRGAVLVDWGAAVRGSRWIDTAFAVLSVRVEGGRVPIVDFPDEGPFAAALSGHLAVEAPEPLPDWAEPGSTLRADMAQDLRHALRWAAEKLDLEPLGQTNPRACGPG